MLLSSDVTSPLPLIDAYDNGTPLMKERARCRTTMRYGLELYHSLDLERGQDALVNEETSRRAFEQDSLRETGWRWEATDDDGASDEAESPDERSRPSSPLSSPPLDARPDGPSLDQFGGPAASPDSTKDSAGDETGGPRHHLGAVEGLAEASVWGHHSATFSMTQPLSPEKIGDMGGKTATGISMDAPRSVSCHIPFRQSDN